MREYESTYINHKRVDTPLKNTKIEIPASRIQYIIKSLEMACRGDDLEERLCKDINYLQAKLDEMVVRE